MLIVPSTHFKVNSIECVKKQKPRFPFFSRKRARENRKMSQKSINQWIVQNELYAVMWSIKQLSMIAIAMAETELVIAHSTNLLNENTIIHWKWPNKKHSRLSFHESTPIQLPAWNIITTIWFESCRNRKHYNARHTLNWTLHIQHTIMVIHFMTHRFSSDFIIISRYFECDMLYHVSD